MQPDTTEGFTLPAHLAPSDATLPTMDDALLEWWVDVLEWAEVMEVDGGCGVL